MAGSSQATSATSSIPLMTPVAFSGARKSSPDATRRRRTAAIAALNEKLEIELPFRLEKY